VIEWFLPDARCPSRGTREKGICVLQKSCCTQVNLASPSAGRHIASAEDDMLVFHRIHVVPELVGGEPELGFKTEVGGGVLGAGITGLVRAMGDNRTLWGGLQVGVIRTMRQKEWGRIPLNCRPFIRGTFLNGVQQFGETKMKRKIEKVRTWMKEVSRRFKKVNWLDPLTYGARKKGKGRDELTFLLNQLTF